jgi:hypothetical protein
MLSVAIGRMLRFSLILLVTESKKTFKPAFMIIKENNEQKCVEEFLR